MAAEEFIPAKISQEAIYTEAEFDPIEVATRALEKLRAHGQTGYVGSVASEDIFDNVILHPTFGRLLEDQSSDEALVPDAELEDVDDGDEDGQPFNYAAEQDRLTEFLSRVFTPREIGITVRHKDAVDLAQEEGLPVNNMTSITRYKKASQRFLLKQAKQGDRFALEQLCTNALSMINKRVGNYIEAFEANPLIGYIPVEVDDLVQTGLDQVPRVVSRWDNPATSFFPSFLGQRLSGAFLDHGREVISDLGLPRSKSHLLMQALKHARQSSKDPREQHERLTANLQQLVEDGFVEAPQYIEDDQLAVGSISLEALRDGQKGELSALIDKANPEDMAIEASDNEELLELINRLPERQRFVIVSYFGFSGVGPQTLSEIGTQMGVTESRVSQLHTKAMKNLRMLMTGQHPVMTAERRGKLANLPERANPHKLIAVMTERLEEYRNMSLFKSDIDNVLRVIPAWDSDHSFSGTDKVTVFTRQVPEDSLDEALGYLRGEGWSISYRAGRLSIEITNPKGRDLQAILGAESALDKISRPANYNQQVELMLSPREAEVMKLLHLNNKEIAQELGIAVSTARTHKHNIFRKFNVKNAKELNVFMANNGLLDPVIVPEDRSTLGLSDREYTLVRDFSRGTYQQAADALGLSTSTIRTHWHNIYIKTGVRDKYELVQLAIRDGIIPLEAPEPERVGS